MPNRVSWTPRDHFSSLNDNDGVEIPPTGYDAACLAFKLLKNNKVSGADGIPAELLKTEGQKFINRAFAFVQHMIRRMKAQR